MKSTPTTKTDKLTIRLLYIITELNKGEKLHTKELAQKFEVSQRVIQKDLNDRLSQFLSISKKDGKYFLDSFLIGRLEYKDIKNFAILSGIKKLYPSLEDGFLSDVLNPNINSSCLVKDGGYEDIDHRQKEFELLKIAIVLKHQISFEYKKIMRVLNPYKLVNNNNIWYLVGDEDSKLKTFSFTKISKLTKTKTEFKPHREFLELIQKNHLNWFSQNTIKVTLEIDASVAEYFQRRELFANQTILKQTKKSLILQTTVSYDEEILRVARYWIPHVRIVEPEYLHVKLVDGLKSYIKL